MNDVDMRCVCCGVSAGSYYESTGTLFAATGNYGSGVFDPFDSTLSLAVVICDDCMVINAPLVVRVEASPLPRPAPSLTTWAPGRAS